MNEHATTEAISSYLDGEVGQDERAELEEHFTVCDQCTRDRHRLERAMNAVRSLPAVEPTKDEFRAIREAVSAVLEGAARKPGFTRAWAIAGAVALVAVGVFGFIASSALKSQRSDTTASRPLESAESQGPLAFSSPEEVRDSVLANPQVQEGVTRYRVKDIGTRQQQVLASFEQGEEEDSAAPAATAAGQTAPAKPPAKPLGTCLREILRGQPYPVMPILARSALFQGTPTYLLVYAFTRSSDNESARLDLVQSWVVDQAACTPLNYQQFDPKKPVPK